MQLYALDDAQVLISAKEALKTHDYFCIECRGIVRKRQGIHRHAHFFHLRPTDSCKLSAKSMAHLHAQWHIQTLLPLDESFIEKRFPEINRIADVVWLPRKIIFEIQCSSIAPEEIRARNGDYASLGYQVVWILNDRRFNQYRLSGAELTLRSSPYFFTNIDKEGQGIIYDQFDIYNKGLRLKKLGRLPVNLSKPSTLPEFGTVALPQMMQARMRSWPLHFEGDLIDQLHAEEGYLREALRAEKELFPPPVPKTWADVLREGLRGSVYLYKLIFRFLLERICK